MRPATKEERESVDRYIKSISHKTGIVCAAGNVDYEEDFEIDDIDFVAEHPKADMSKVNRIIVNGKVYLSVDKVLELIDELSDTKSLVKATPLGSYLHKTYARRMKEAVKKLKGGKQG